MKLKKLFASMLAVGAALALAIGFAACGNSDDKDKDKDKDTDEVTITYQFTGANDELSGYGMAYYVYLNLWSDGSVSGSGYNYLWTEGGLGGSSALKEKWFRGSWEEKADEDAGKIVQLKAIWDTDATNDMNGGTSTAGRIENYSLYFADDGKTLTDFTLKIPLMSERNAEMTCHVPALYADKDAFVQGAIAYGEAHMPGDDGGDEEEDYGNVLVTFKSSDDKEAVFYDSGVVVIDAGRMKPVLGWKYENNAFTFTETDGDKKGQTTDAATLTVDGTMGTLTYSYMEYINVTYTGDVSKLIGEEAEPTTIATFAGAGGATLEIYDNGKAMASFYNGMMKINFTYKVEGGVLILTDAEHSEKVYRSEGTSLKITDGYANDTFTIDLSKLS